MAMSLERKKDGWWITGVPDSITECGPYDRKADAADDRRGMKRFFVRFNELEKKRGRRRGKSASKS